MQGFEQRTVGSAAVCQQELKVDATAARSADAAVGPVGRPSTIHGR